MEDADEPLVVRESVRGHTRIVAWAVAGLLVSLILTVLIRGTGLWVLWCATLIVPGLIGVRAARRGDWALRIDADGLHWPDDTRLPWTAIAEIRVGRPAKDPARPIFAGRHALTVVTTAQADFARRAGVRPIGRVIPHGTLTASPDEILAAVHRFAPIPVVRTGRIQRSDRGRTV